jgi:hemerythrin
MFLDAADTISQTKYLIGLFKFTRLHFSHEEDLMRMVHYPEISFHLQEHAELVDRLSAFAECVSNNTIAKDVWGNFLADWLISHITSSDAELAGFVKSLPCPGSQGKSEVCRHG